MRGLPLDTHKKQYVKLVDHKERRGKELNYCHYVQYRGGRSGSKFKHRYKLIYRYSQHGVLIIYYHRSHQKFASDEEDAGNWPRSVVPCPWFVWSLIVRWRRKLFGDGFGVGNDASDWPERPDYDDRGYPQDDPAGTLKDHLGWAFERRCRLGVTSASFHYLMTISFLIFVLLQYSLFLTILFLFYFYKQCLNKKTPFSVQQKFKLWRL